VKTCFSADSNIGRGGGSSRIGNLSAAFVARGLGDEGCGLLRKTLLDGTGFGLEVWGLVETAKGDDEGEADGCDFNEGGAGEGPSTSELMSVSVEDTSESSSYRSVCLWARVTILTCTGTRGPAADFSA